jgi:transposase InsO family protein
VTAHDAREMSGHVSPATGERYGVQRVCAVWHIARSSVYADAAQPVAPLEDAAVPPRRRGPRSAISDETLAGYIRAAIADSPFTGEGHRKIHQRVQRTYGIHVGRDRVLRLMNALQLLSPARVPAAPADPHDGTIVTDAPNVMWATDGFRVRTRDDGWIWGFVVVDHWNSECLGIHLCKHGTRFNALEPLAQALTSIYGSTQPDVARGLALRMDHGSQFSSRHYRQQLRYWGITPSYAFVGEPQTNGVAERFIRTLKEQKINGSIYTTLEELRTVLTHFVAQYNREWMVARHGHRSPLQIRADFVTMNSHVA